MVSQTTKKENLENKSSLTSRKVWDVEQKSNPIIDVGNIAETDLRMVNNYPNGQLLTLRDNDGAFYDVRVSDGKLLKANSTYTEI